jgi:hypothetical protein
MLHLLGRGQNDGQRNWNIGLRSAAQSKDALVLMGKYFDKPGLRFRPIVEKPGCTRAAGQFEMPRQQPLYEFGFTELAVSELGFENWLEVN